MAEITLRADTGRTTGSRPARRLRREGFVPATLYGKDAQPLSVAVGGYELRRALGTEAGINAILTIEVDGTSHTALAREIQRHPVRGDIIHLDFVKISLTDRVDAVVGIEFVGDPVGVREDGGIVETIATSVTLQALVTAIPESVRLDISELGVGDTLKVSDLPELEGVDFLDDPDSPVVTVSIPAAVEAEVVEEEEEEAAVEEGAEEAEGEAAEAGEEQAGGE